MVGITAAFGIYGQASAALSLTDTAKNFSRTRGFFSGLSLIDTVAEIVGVERITGQIVKYAVNLALKSDAASEEAAREMVELMRSRVPVDTGLLLSGITYRREGNMWVVEASADKDGYDYALAVEAGHRAGGHADADFFEDTTGRGGRQVSSGPTEVEAQPYFYNSAREALAEWRANLGQASGGAAREAGL